MPDETNDHDLLRDLVPRVKGLEKDADRHQRLIDQLATSVQALRDDVQRANERLADKFDVGFRETRSELSERLDAINDHLVTQDADTATLRESVAGARSAWPQSAVVFTSIAGTVAGGILIVALTHLLAHWPW